MLIGQGGWKKRRILHKNGTVDEVKFCSKEKLCKFALKVSFLVYSMKALFASFSFLQTKATQNVKNLFVFAPIAQHFFLRNEKFLMWKQREFQTWTFGHATEHYPRAALLSDVRKLHKQHNEPFWIKVIKNIMKLQLLPAIPHVIHTRPP